MNEEIKHILTQYKRDNEICGSPNIGYIHRETTIPSFTLSSKMKG
jgi:hypothetical protein